SELQDPGCVGSLLPPAFRRFPAVSLVFTGDSTAPQRCGFGCLHS
ncbi:MAG: hypothetical protein ACI9ME_000801, partial [Ilumatobacter sp.]